MGNAVVPPDDPRHPILRLPGATRVPAGPTHDGDGLTLISFLLARSPLVSRPSHMPWLWSLPQIPSPPWCSTKIRRIPVPPALVGSTRLCLFPKSPRNRGRPFHLRDPCSMCGITTNPRVARGGRRRRWISSPTPSWSCNSRPLLQTAVRPATNDCPPCYRRSPTLLQRRRRCYK
jgi:hypothetical protein